MVSRSELIARWLCQDCLLPVVLLAASRELLGAPNEPRCVCGGELCCCSDCEDAARVVAGGSTLAERVALAKAGGVSLREGV